MLRSHVNTTNIFNMSNAEEITKLENWLDIAESNYQTALGNFCIQETPESEHDRFLEQYFQLIDKVSNFRKNSHIK